MKLIVWLVSFFRRADSTTPYNASDRRFDATGGRLASVHLKEIVAEAERLATKSKKPSKASPRQNREAVSV